MILKTVYHMNLLDFRNFLLKFVLRNLFSHCVKSLKNNSCLSSHGSNPMSSYNNGLQEKFQTVN